MIDFNDSPKPMKMNFIKKEVKSVGKILNLLNDDDSEMNLDTITYLILVVTGVLLFFGIWLVTAMTQ